MPRTAWQTALGDVVGEDEGDGSGLGAEGQLASRLLQPALLPVSQHRRPVRPLKLAAATALCGAVDRLGDIIGGLWISADKAPAR